MNENVPGRVAVAKLALDNDTAKKIAMLIAGKIPKAGGVLSGMIGMFWPTDEVSLWDQIKDQVEALVSQSCRNTTCRCWPKHCRDCATRCAATKC